MKIAHSLSLALVLAAGLLTGGVAPAHAESDMKMPDQAAAGQLVRVTDQTDAAWLAKAKADYPLTTCTVSGDKLEGGDMGKPQDYIYKEEGKPDRLVRFCCKDCLKDFNKNPVKYLKMIDDATAKAKNMGDMPMK